MNAEDPTAVLDDLLLELGRCVAEHYVPWTGGDDDGYEGSDSDDEAVWDRALDALVLGSWADWETPQGLERIAESPRFDRTLAAYTAIVRIAVDAANWKQHEERLFGPEHVTVAKYPSPEWCVRLQRPSPRAEMERQPSAVRSVALSLPISPTSRADASTTLACSTT